MITTYRHREKRGCWLEDKTINQLLLLDRKPLHLYLTLCLPRTQDDYPEVAELAMKLGLTRKQVLESLTHLHAFGLLNDSDLDKIIEQPL